MTLEERQKIYQKVLNKTDPNLQIIKAMEELAELIKELSHYLASFNKFDPNNLIKEIADTEIMIEQLKLVFNLKQEIIEGWKDIKLDRLKYKFEINA